MLNAGQNFLIVNECYLRCLAVLDAPPLRLNLDPNLNRISKFRCKIPRSYNRWNSFSRIFTTVSKFLPHLATIHKLAPMSASHYGISRGNIRLQFHYFALEGSNYCKGTDQSRNKVLCLFLIRHLATQQPNSTSS